jgi:hypothetical protein
MFQSVPYHFVSVIPLYEPKSTMFFIAFVIFLALAWAAVGVLLAKWLKQAGHARPFNVKGRERDVYGAGVGYGREVGLQGMGRDVSGFGGDGGRRIGLGEGSRRVGGM